MTNHRTEPNVSRRTALAGLAAGGLGLTAVGAARQASAQDATPGAAGGHALVGTWLFTFPHDPEHPALDTFGADGTLVQSGPGGEGAGAWRATGPAVAELTVVLLQGTEAAVIHATIDVDGAAGTLDGHFTLEGLPGVGGPVHGDRVVVGEPGIPSRAAAPAGTPTG